MITNHDSDGWLFETTEEISDERAAEFTFWAAPKDVVLGESVQIIDAQGTRIGHVSCAKYVERLFGPAVVICAVTLR